MGKQFTRELFTVAIKPVASTCPSSRRPIARRAFVEHLLTEIDLHKGLQFLGRLHDPESAERSVTLSRETGFRTVSVDLIYGLPGQSAAGWKEELTVPWHCNRITSVATSSPSMREPVSGPGKSAVR